MLNARMKPTDHTVSFRLFGCKAGGNFVLFPRYGYLFGAA
jgi:hypothetical protein